MTYTYTPNVVNCYKTHPFVGKYVRAQLEFYKRDNEWYETECFCESFWNDMFTVRTKQNKFYRIPLQQIKYVIQVHTIQQFNIDNVVEAIVSYHQYQGTFYDFCKILNVNHFANDIDYDLLILSSNKKITVPQTEIKCLAILKKSPYKVGDYVGVKYYGGCQYDPEIKIKNGVISEVKEWYDKITYYVKHDDGSNSNVSFENIVAPKEPEPIKTQEQIQKEQLEFLNNEERRLLEQLEKVRHTKTHYFSD
jgi:hypothetical protein